MAATACGLPLLLMDMVLVGASYTVECCSVPWAPAVLVTENVSLSLPSWGTGKVDSWPRGAQVGAGCVRDTAAEAEPGSYGRCGAAG